MDLLKEINNSLINMFKDIINYLIITDILCLYKYNN